MVLVVCYLFINSYEQIWCHFKLQGQSGHGSKLFDNTPGEKLDYVLNKMYEYRAEEKRKVDDLKYPEGNVTSINLTKVKGGVANNVIPTELSATFDIRVSINDDVDAFVQRVSIKKNLSTVYS